MPTLRELGEQFVELAAFYPRSLYEGWKQRNLFENVSTFCLFIGYPKSGHSLIGSLLDAHPEMVIAHELDVLRFIYARFSARQIYHLSLANARTMAQGGRQKLKFSYEVPNQWQGRFTRLRVIGDKQGEATTLRLQACPWLLQRLHREMAREIKFIHVLRNPYDNIASIAHDYKSRPMDLPQSIDYYFSLCRTVAEVKKQIKSENFFELDTRRLSKNQRRTCRPSVDSSASKCPPIICRMAPASFAGRRIGVVMKCNGLRS